jgi:sodium-coupled neutral amino acid transporter 7/8
MKKGKITRIRADGASDRLLDNDAQDDTVTITKGRTGQGAGTNASANFDTPDTASAKDTILGYKNRNAPLPHRVQTPIDQRKADIQYGGKGTIMSSIFTLASSAIGAGILSFPYAFKEAGLVTAVLVCLGLTLVMSFSVHAIVHSTAEAQKTDPRIRSYEDLVLVATGKKTATFLEVVIVFYQYSVCVGFLIVIGDMLQPLAENYLPHGSFLANRDAIIAIVGLCVCMPLCMLKELFMLRYASVLSVFSVLYMVLMIMGEELDHQHNAPQKVELFKGGTGVFITIPLMCFALQCQIPSPLIYTELHHSIKSVAKMDVVLVGAYAVCCAFYIPAGIFGYYTFGEGTISDLLSTSSDPVKAAHSYAVSDKFAFIARICIASVATCGVPLNHFPARTAVYSLYGKVFSPVRPQ